MPIPDRILALLRGVDVARPAVDVQAAGLYNPAAFLTGPAQVGAQSLTSLTYAM